MLLLERSPAHVVWGTVVLQVSKCNKAALAGGQAGSWGWPQCKPCPHQQAPSHRVWTRWAELRTATGPSAAPQHGKWWTRARSKQNDSLGVKGDRDRDEAKTSRRQARNRGLCAARWWPEMVTSTAAVSPGQGLMSLESSTLESWRRVMSYVQDSGRPQGANRNGKGWQYPQDHDTGRLKSTSVFLAISAHLDISYILALAYMVQPHQQAKICANEYPLLWCICLQGHFIARLSGQSEVKVRPWKI